MNGSKSVRKQYVADHIAKLPKSGIREFFDLVNAMKDVISLGVGEPDFVTPWTIRESAVFSLEKGHTSYTSNLGTLTLRGVETQTGENEYEYTTGTINVDGGALVIAPVTSSLSGSHMTRLNLVWKMADIIADAITTFLAPSGSSLAV